MYRRHGPRPGGWVRPYEAGDEVEPSAEGFDVAGHGVDGGQLAAFDLGHPAGRDSHGLGEVGLGESVALAFFGEPLAALAAHQDLAASFGFLLAAGAAGSRKAAGQLPKFSRRNGVTPGARGTVRSS